jgi:hypothetical protein
MSCSSIGTTRSRFRNFVLIAKGAPGLAPESFSLLVIGGSDAFNIVVFFMMDLASSPSIFPLLERVLVLSGALTHALAGASWTIYAFC